MVKFTTGSNAFVDFDGLDISVLLDGDITSHSSTKLVLDLGFNDIVTFFGTSFHYDKDGDPDGGTITGITETDTGQTLYEITGMNTPVAQFVDWVVRNASDEALRGILSGNDDLTGGPAGDGLFGYAGHDNIAGGNGSDTLRGGSGNDHIYGQSANGGADGGDQLYGDEGSDYIQGNAGNDSLDGGDGSDRIQGGKDDDSIRGGNDNDTVNGNLGNDSIDGQQGNDSLRGGQGNDSINGGIGNDVLSGDLGTDTLTGGADADIFSFLGQGSTIAGGPDRITDFADGTDHISVGYSPAAVLEGASQASLSAASTAAQQLFDGHAGNGEIAVLAVGSDAYVFYSSDGGAVVDSAVLISGVTPSAFTVQDFV